MGSSTKRKQKKKNKKKKRKSLSRNLDEAKDQVEEERSPVGAESDLQWPRVGQPPKITEIGCERSFGPSLKAKLIEGKAEAKAVEVMRASDETEDAEEEEENSEEPEPRLGVGDKLKGKATQLALGDVKGEEEEASEKEEKKKKKKKVKRKKRTQDPQAQLLAQAVQA